MNNSKQYNTCKNSKGTIRIAPQVITSLVSNAIAELGGKAILSPMVHMSTPKWAFLNKTLRPVRMELRDGVATISARLLVSHEVKLREYSEQLQSAIKDAIQSMTGIIIRDVNLTFVGIMDNGEKA